MELDARLAAADAVVSGEGRLDDQTLTGKAIAEVARRCRAAERPLHVVVGSRTLDDDDVAALGLASVREATTLEELRAPAGRWPRRSGTRGRREGERMTTILRAHVFHTPRNPFAEPGALEAFDDGAVAFDAEGTILATGPFPDVRREHPDAEVTTVPGGYPVPRARGHARPLPPARDHRRDGAAAAGVAAHPHAPRRRRGSPTRRWRATPRGASCYRLLANGTTSALVFGTHSPRAQDIFFQEAEASGLRITSGLVVSDRELLPELHTTPEEAHRASRDLLRRWHGRGRLRYAVTPRFSLSCTDAMLEACRAVLEEDDGVFFTSHINENPDEVAFVAQLFPWSRDYLDTYERFSLVGAAQRVRARRPRHRLRARAGSPPRAPASRTARRATRSWAAGCSR